MATIRTFVAVELSSGVRSRAASLIERLRVAGAKVTWTAPHNMHLTLKFLGDVPDVDSPGVCQAVDEAVSGVASFEIMCRGAGAFPDTRRPRTLWLGVDSGLDELVALHAKIDAALAPLGFARERRRFQPHLTIGRVRESGPKVEELCRLVEKHADFEADLSVVDEVTVMASFLERTGPKYEALGRTELRG